MRYHYPSYGMAKIKKTENTKSWQEYWASATLITAGGSTATWGNWLMILSKAEQVCISIHQDPVNLLYAVNLSLSPHSSSHLMRRLSRAVVCLQGDHRYCLHSLLRSTVGKHFDVHGFSSILVPYRDFYNAELLYQSKIFYLLSCLAFLFNKVYKNTSIQHELLPKFFFVLCSTFPHQQGFNGHC